MNPEPERWRGPTTNDVQRQLLRAMGAADVANRTAFNSAREYRRQKRHEGTAPRYSHDNISKLEGTAMYWVAEATRLNTKVAALAAVLALLREAM